MLIEKYYGWTLIFQIGMKLESAHALVERRPFFHVVLNW